MSAAAGITQGTGTATTRPARAFRTVRAYGGSALTLFLGLGAQFAWFILLARALGSTQFGYFTLINAVGMVACAICGLGADETAMRRAARDPADFPAMLGHGLILLLATGIPLIALSSALLFRLLPPDPALLRKAAMLVMFSTGNILLYSFNTFVERAHIGHHKLWRANAVNLGFVLTRLAAAAIACLFGLKSLWGWALWSFAGQAAWACVCAGLLLRLARPRWRLDRKEALLGFHYTTPNLLEALRQNLDRILLGVWVPAPVLGSYAAAARMASTSQMAINSLNRVAYPLFVRRAGQGLAATWRLARLYLLAIMAVAGMTGLAVYLAAPLMPLILGHQYQPVVGYLRILCWLVVPIAAQTVPYDIFGALEMHALRAHLYNSVTVAGLAGIVLALSRAGLTGVFWAFYVLQITLALVLWAALLGQVRRLRAGPAEIRSDA